MGGWESYKCGCHMVSANSENGRMSFGDLAKIVESQKQHRRLRTTEEEDKIDHSKDEMSAPKIEP